MHPDNNVNSHMRLIDIALHDSHNNMNSLSDEERKLFFEFPFFFPSWYNILHAEQNVFAKSEPFSI